MTDFGQVFPPRDEWDVAAYEADDVVAGYREHTIYEKPPGDNRSPGYRWGWANARKDVTRTDDGFELVRSAYIQMTRMMN